MYVTNGSFSISSHSCLMSEGESSERGKDGYAENSDSLNPSSTEYKDLRTSTKSSIMDNKAFEFLTSMKASMDANFSQINENQNELNDKIGAISERLNEVETFLNEDTGANTAHNVSASDEENSNADATNNNLRTAGDSGNISNDGTLDKTDKEKELLDELLKQAGTSEIVDDDVDTRISDIVNSVFKKRMDKELYKKLTSDDSNPRPKNCEALKTVSTNRMLWDNLTETTRTNDKKLQNHQRTLVKVSIIVTKLFDILAKAKESKAPLDMDMLITKMNNALCLLGDMNFNINMFRRALMKNEMKDQYKKLCSDTVPFSSELFGDELAKLAKDVGETNKMGTKIHKFNAFRGRMRGRYPYNNMSFRGGSSYQTRPSFTARRGGYQPYNANQARGQGYFSRGQNFQHRGKQKPKQ